MKIKVQVFRNKKVLFYFFSFQLLFSTTKSHCMFFGHSKVKRQNVVSFRSLEKHMLFVLLALSKTFVSASKKEMAACLTIEWVCLLLHCSPDQRSDVLIGLIHHRQKLFSQGFSKKYHLLIIYGSQQTELAKLVKQVDQVAWHRTSSKKITNLLPISSPWIILRQAVCFGVVT